MFVQHVVYKNISIIVHEAKKMSHISIQEVQVGPRMCSDLPLNIKQYGSQHRSPTQWYNGYESNCIYEARTRTWKENICTQHICVQRNDMFWCLRAGIVLFYCNKHLVISKYVVGIISLHCWPLTVYCNSSVSSRQVEDTSLRRLAKGLGYVDI